MDLLSRLWMSRLETSIFIWTFALYHNKRDTQKEESQNEFL